MSQNEIATMRGEISAIETRIDRAWEGIKKDIARKEWLTQQIIKSSTYMPNLSERNWDAIDDAFDKFLEGFHDIDGERYEKRSARNGGEWMKHLIRQAMKAPNTDFNLTPPSESQVKS